MLSSFTLHPFYEILSFLSISILDIYLSFPFLSLCLYFISFLPPRSPVSHSPQSGFDKHHIERYVSCWNCIMYARCESTHQTHAFTWITTLLSLQGLRGHQDIRSGGRKGKKSNYLHTWARRTRQEEILWHRTDRSGGVTRAERFIMVKEEVSMALQIYESIYMAKKNLVCKILHL